MLQKPLSDTDRRMQKIAKYKKERECKQRIEVINFRKQILSIAKTLFFSFAVPKTICRRFHHRLYGFGCGNGNERADDFAVTALCAIMRG